MKLHDYIDISYIKLLGWKSHTATSGQTLVKTSHFTHFTYFTNKTFLFLVLLLRQDAWGNVCPSHHTLIKKLKLSLIISRLHDTTNIIYIDAETFTHCISLLICEYFFISIKSVRKILKKYKRTWIVYQIQDRKDKFVLNCKLIKLWRFFRFM